MTMTAKDKKLLVIAGGVLIALAIIMFGIKPGINGWLDSKDKKAELSAKKTEMQTEIAALPSYNAQYAAAVEAYNKIAAQVFGDYTNDKIQDAVVNDLITPCGLSVSSFSISGVTKNTVVPYTVTTAESGQTTGEGGTNAENASVRMATVSVGVVGSNDQIITLLDKLDSTPGVFLQQTSFSRSAENTSVSVSFLMVLTETY